MESDQAALIAEQLGRLADRIDARLKAVETAQGAHEAIEAERSASLKAQLADLKTMTSDHETRLRTLQDETTRARVILGLSSGGAVLASLAAALRAFLP
jgi:thioesterase domain-containing protein